MNLAPYKVGDMSTSDPVPEATYRLRINGMDFRDPNDPEFQAKNPRSKAKHPSLQADFVIMDEMAPDNITLVLGRHIFVTLTFKKGGDFMLRQLLEAAGKDDDWMLIDDEGNAHWDELVEGEVMGVVTIQEEKQDPITKETYPRRNEVKKFLPVF